MENIGVWRANPKIIFIDWVKNEKKKNDYLDMKGHESSESMDICDGRTDMACCVINAHTKV